MNDSASPTTRGAKQQAAVVSWQDVASGLRFPEGPIVMADGSIVLVEIARGTLSRVSPNGQVDVVAELGGGPNGAAIGPDGRVYVCNNGGFEWREVGGRLFPGLQANDYRGGSIQAVDPVTGSFETLYTECAGRPLRGPNDIVFDDQGGFWFTDLGKNRERDRDRTGIYYATIDGRSIVEKAFPLVTPNGIGLSPLQDRVYVAETESARLYYWNLKGPGEIDPHPRSPHGGHFLAGPGGLRYFDSLAIDGEGNVNVATIVDGGITVVSPDGQSVTHVPTDDPLTTNICFGGADLRDAWVTLSSTGRLAKGRWPRPGLQLAFNG